MVTLASAKFVIVLPWRDQPRIFMSDVELTKFVSYTYRLKVWAAEVIKESRLVEGAQLSISVYEVCTAESCTTEGWSRIRIDRALTRKGATKAESDERHSSGDDMPTWATWRVVNEQYALRQRERSTRPPS
jgi:hypothetical protein